MSMPADRIQEILGLKPTIRGTADWRRPLKENYHAALSSALSPHAGVTGNARLALLHGLVPSAAFKHRTHLKLHESEKTERLARVIALAELLWDDAEAAQRFLSAPQPELQNRTRLDKTATKLGACQVEDLVVRAIYGLLDLNRAIACVDIELQTRALILKAARVRATRSNDRTRVTNFVANANTGSVGRSVSEAGRKAKRCGWPAAEQDAKRCGAHVWRPLEFLPVAQSSRPARLTPGPC
jgi:putative toxin-antitoxin system antitoxin component (TIGR02293 family)